MNKRGEFLVENVIFLILNLVFIGILVLFLLKQGSGVVLLEDSYSKQIALLIDSAKPGMIMKLDMGEGLKIAEENGIDFGDCVEIDLDKNIVLVRLTEEGGSQYHFFNEVAVGEFPERDKDSNEYTGIHSFTISEEIENEE